MGGYIWLDAWNVMVLQSGVTWQAGSNEEPQGGTIDRSLTISIPVALSTHLSSRYLLCVHLSWMPSTTELAKSHPQSTEIQLLKVDSAGGRRTSSIANDV